MRKYLILLITLLLSATNYISASHRESAMSIKRGVELYDSGRWIDARCQFAKVREMLPTTAVSEYQTVDFYLTMCAVKLNEADVETQMLNFMNRYKGSAYINDINFALASYYCTRDEFDKARSRFADVNYQVLTPEQREKYDIRVGYIEFLDKNYDEAYKYFDRLGVASEYFSIFSSPSLI